MMNGVTRTHNSLVVGIGSGVGIGVVVEGPGFIVDSGTVTAVREKRNNSVNR